MKAKSGFLSKPLAKPVAAFLIILAIFFACGILSLLAVWSWEPPHINITRAQYESALAKWKAHKVEEYEITTYTRALGGGTNTLHVTDYGNKVEILAPTPTPPDTLSDGMIEYLKSDTVEGLFVLVDTLLRDNGESNVGAATEKGYYMSYQVSFDPVLGYPTHIDAHAVTKPGFYISDTDWDETVTNLKIIKQGN